MFGVAHGAPVMHSGNMTSYEVTCFQDRFSIAPAGPLVVRLISLQYNEIEKPNHHAMVSTKDVSSSLRRSTSMATMANNVAAMHSAIVLSQLARGSDFNQNNRINSQYPEPPIAEPTSK